MDWAAEHEFVRDAEQDIARGSRWQTRAAARYYAKLHKEFAIIDLSRWQEGVCGLRWRTEREVVEGKGEEWCGARKCPRRGCQTYELPFSYREHGEDKMELVKVVVCEECATKVRRL